MAGMLKPGSEILGALEASQEATCASQQISRLQAGVRGVEDRPLVPIGHMLGTGMPMGGCGLAALYESWPKQ